MPAELQRRARKNSRVLHNIKDAAGRARARVRGTAHQAPDARVDHGPGAHGAGLEGDVQRGVEEPVARERLPGRPQRDHLGVRARIVRAYRLVPAFGDYRAVVDDDRAHGYFPSRLRLPRQLQCPPHI
jgi:hypothetical protein